MGSFFSSVTATDEAASSESSLVQSFHSSARWKTHFNSVQNSSKLMVVDFSTTWSGPCRLMERALNAIASKYTDVEFAKIDVDELADVAQEYEVKAMSTFVLLKGGSVVAKVVGAHEEELVKKIDNHRPA